MAIKLRALQLTNEAVFKFFAVWASVSSLTILLLVKFVSANELFYTLKDLPLYIFMVFLCASWIKTKRSANLLIALIIFVVILFLNYILVNPEYVNPLANIRQIIAPIAILLFFCSLRLDTHNIWAIERTLARVVLYVFFFGLLEASFQLWKSFDLSIFFQLKGIPVDAHGLSYMFYEPMFGYRERMTSSFLDPISLGHFFASALIYFYYRHGLKSEFKFTMAICLAGLILAMSKGAILQSFLALTLLNPALNFFLRLSAILPPILFFVLSSNKAGVLIHLKGLANSIESISFFGHGIGSTGNYAKMFSDNLDTYYKIGISDTYFGSLLGQTGIAGVAIWFFLIYLVVSPIKRTSKLDVIILTSVIIVSFVSENTMNVTSFMLPAIFISLAYWRKNSYNE